MIELQLFKILIFPGTFQKLQNWIKFSIFSYLKSLSVFIINGSTILC